MKNYQRPTIRTVQLFPRTLLVAVSRVEGNSGIGYGGGGSGPARTPQRTGIWEETEEME
ncbi:MAG: hypothetical protein IJ722_07760 [Alloprevotella sp.]|nr:hypothetical protein [Alloprevotella sp.]